MKKIICAALAVLMLFSLVGCGESSDVPDGMQLISGSDALGYYFYAPEEWQSANLGGVAATYISAVNTTSVTFTEVDKSNFAIEDDTMSTEDYFLYHYFNDTKGEFPADTVYGDKCGEERLFGAQDYRADKAVIYTYTYKYNEVTYGFMQYFAVHNGDCFILTYSAIYEVIKGYEQSRYDEYLEMVTKIVENFRFVDKSSEVGGAESYPADEYRLVSDAKIAGFEFYAPGSFMLDYSSAIVSVTAADGSNVNLTESMGTGVTPKAYFEDRLKELGAIATDITVIKQDEAAKLGNVPEVLGSNTMTNFAFAYEYTYVFGGEIYHVYQILAAEGWLLNADGYVFTYTAKEANYEKHLDEVKTMIEKVVFK